MAPLILEGLNLGSRHKQFNLQVNEAIKNEVLFETISTESGDSDIDMLFKIELASNYRNVNYIINVFKSEDMLYVSRAINKSLWLVTEDKYAHIINCQYLHEQLFPHMISKAISKLLLLIRLHLNDDKRGDEFYAHYKTIDPKIAVKWLPNCSLEVVKRVLNKNFESVDANIFKKLCEKYPEVFDICANKGKTLYIKKHLETVVFILNTNTEKYLDVLEKCEQWNSWFKFNKRQTKTIMKKCPDRILKKFKLYCNYVHIDSVAKLMQADTIKDFLITISKNPELYYWLTYNHLKPFLKYMPREGKFEFVKEVFITKSYKDKIEDSDMSGAACLGEAVQSEKIYQWYKYAPFDVAFTDLKKIIKTESAPEERSAILRTMLASTRHNTTNVLKVIEYYHQKHINEAFKFKINFINFLLTYTNTHHYDKASWKILDELFYSCEVYMESNNNVQHCVEVILVYKLLHDQPIPKIIEKKFKFNSLKKIKNKLNKTEKDIVFLYLFNHMEKEINSQSTDNEGVKKIISFINDAMELLSDWNKNLNDYPNILKKIREIAFLKHDLSLDVNLNDIYNKKRAWKKYMFEESLLLSESQNVYINVLKHDPTLLQKYSKQVKAVQCNDNIILNNFLSKLKTYWNESLAIEWANAYRSLVNETGGYKALTLGLCGVLPRKELLEFFDKKAPADYKIDWSEVNEHIFSLRKAFAQLMYNARPQPPASCILRYARGDYLQYATPSLNAIFYNISSQDFRESLPELFNDAVSLQKHGIRFAFAKLKSHELKNIITNNWNSTKNISMRAVIFQLTFNLLRKEKSDSKTEELWDTLEKFIDNLTDEENPTIYKLLGSVKEVPKHVQGKFCRKSYRFLKKMPPKANCQSNLDNLIKSISEIMDNIDHDIVEEILMEFNQKGLFKYFSSIDHFYQPQCPYKEVLVKYLLCTSDTNQELRYDKIIKPWLGQLFSVWNKINKQNKKEGETYFNDWILNVAAITRSNFVNKKFANPRKVFKKILDEIQSNLKCEDNYHVRTALRLLIVYSECYDKIKLELVDTGDEHESTEEFNQRCYNMWEKVAPLLAVKVVGLLEDDMEKLFPSVWVIFARTVSEIYEQLANNTDCMNDNYVFETELIKNEEFPPAALIALKILPQNLWDTEQQKKLNQVKKLLNSHPSKEVRMHFYKKYHDFPIIPVCDEVNEE